MLKLLSIILPVYNAEKTVEKIIKNIIQQKYENFELLIINDGSTDKTAVLIQKYAQEDSRIKIYTKDKNEGVSAARNIGIENAQGEYIAFVDADDKIDLDIYVKQIDAIEVYECDISMCKLIYETEGSGRCEEEQILIDMKEGKLSDSEYKEFITGFLSEDKHILAGVVRYVFRKNILNDIRFDKEIFYCEDLVFLIELLAVRRKIYFNDFAGYYYVRNAVSTVEKYHEKLFENLLYVYNKVFQIVKETWLVDEWYFLYNYKILECVSFSISNLYRYNAPKRSISQYIQEIKKILREIYKINMKILKHIGLKYRILLILSKIRAYLIIHILYSVKENFRQNRLNK